MIIKWEAYVNRDMLKALKINVLNEPKQADLVADKYLKNCKSWKKHDWIKLSRLNKELKKANIDPLNFANLSKKFGSNHLMSAMIYGLDPDDGTLERIFLSQHDCLELFNYLTFDGCEWHGSEQDFLKYFETFTLKDIDGLIINSYLNIIFNGDLEECSKLDYRFEEDVATMKDKIFDLDSPKLIFNPLRYKQVAKLVINE